MRIIRGLFGVIGFVVLLVAVIQVLNDSGSVNGTGGTPSYSGTYPDPVTAFVGEPVITQAEYARISNGMSYNEVVVVIGAKGEEVSQNHMDGVDGVMEPLTTVMYMWANPDGSNANAMFQNDKLIQKAQFGLK